MDLVGTPDLVRTSEVVRPKRVIIYTKNRNDYVYY